MREPTREDLEQFIFTAFVGLSPSAPVPAAGGDVGGEGESPTGWLAAMLGSIDCTFMRFAMHAVGGYRGIFLWHVTETWMVNALSSPEARDGRLRFEPVRVNVSQLARDTGLSRPELARVKGLLLAEGLLVERDGGLEPNLTARPPAVNVPPGLAAYFRGEPLAGVYDP